MFDSPSQKSKFVMPVNDDEIPEFGGWINWNRFRLAHPGFDFAVYKERINSRVMKCVIGLPKTTKIRSIAKGKVKFILSEKRLKDSIELDPYFESITINHGSIYKFTSFPLLGEPEPSDPSLCSSYSHVVPEPTLKKGQDVEQGEVIATLYSDEGDIGGLTHLHFEAFEFHPFRLDKKIDPAILLPKISQIPVAQPQGSLDFCIGAQYRPNITISNFKKVVANLQSRTSDGIVENLEPSYKWSLTE